MSASSPTRFLTTRQRVGAACGLVSALLYGFHSTIPDLPRPFLIAEIGSDAYRYQWVSGAFTIGVLVGMAILPYLRTRLGLRRCYLLGLIAYGVGGVGLGWWIRDDYSLVLPIFVTSLGDGLLVTTVLSLLWIEFPGRRDWSVGLYIIGLYAGRVLAPVVSGFTINEPSWRTVVIFPAALAGLVLVVAYESLDSDDPPPSIHPPFDFLGLGLLLCWFICLLVGLGRFQLWGWDTSDATIVYYVIGALTFVAFIIHQATVAHPLFDFSLLRIRRWTMAVLIKAIADTTFATVLLLVVRYMVIIREYPRVTAAYVLLPSVASMVLVQLVMARYGTRDNRKPRLVIGMLGMAIGTWLLAQIDLFTDKWWIAMVLAIWSGCTGLAGSPVVCINFEGLTPSQVASSASIKNVMRILPTSIGVGLLTIVLNWRETAFYDLERQTIEVNRPGVADARAWIEDQIAPRSLRPSDVPAQAGKVLSGWVRSNSAAWADQAILRWLAIVTGVGAAMSMLLKPLPPEAPGPLRG